jgi:antitoxin HigA-1
MKTSGLKNISPGEILAEEFLKPLGISRRGLAEDIAIPPQHVTEIIDGQRAINADTADRLGSYFQMSPQFWSNLQSHYDLENEQDRKIE